VPDQPVPLPSPWPTLSSSAVLWTPPKFSICVAASAVPDVMVPRQAHEAEGSVKAVPLGTLQSPLEPMTAMRPAKPLLYLCDVTR